MKELKITSISELKPGDIIRNLGDSDSFVVTTHCGGRVIASRTVQVTNPSEWVVIKQEETTAAAVPLPPSGTVCLWETAPFSLLDVRRLEAKLTALNVRPCRDGFFHGHIGIAEAKKIYRNRNPEHQRFFDSVGHDCFHLEHDHIFVCSGIRLQVKSEQAGILVWGRW